MEAHYIHGIHQVETTDDRIIKPRNMRRIEPKKFVNYGAFTEGQLRLMIELERLQLLDGYYETAGANKFAQDMIIDALYAGLHTAPGVGMLTGTVPNSVKKVAKLIRQQKRKYSPAGGRFQATKEIQTIAGPFDPLQGDFQVPLEDCDIYLPGGSGQGGGPFGGGTAYDPNLLNQCVAQNQQIDNINKHFVKGAHHLLYDYMTTAQVNASPAIVQNKQFEHRNAMIKISNFAYAPSLTNLKAWGSNGIMRSSFQEAGTPFTPAQNIESLIRHSTEGIGEPLTIATATLLLTKIAGVLLAAATLVSAWKGGKMSNSERSSISSVMENFGDILAGAQKGDFDGTDKNIELEDDDDDDKDSDNSAIGFALLAGAAALLLTNK